MIARWTVIGLALLAMSVNSLDSKPALDGDPVSELAQTQVRAAYQHMIKKLEDCRENPLNLTPQRQKEFNLTPAQWSTALKHLYFKADQRCMDDTEIRLGAFTHRYFALQKTRGGPLDPIIMPDGEKVSMEFLEIVLYALYNNELNAQLKFEKLPVDAQKRLLKAPEFQKPFSVQNLDLK